MHGSLAAPPVTQVCAVSSQIRPCWQSFVVAHAPALSARSRHCVVVPPGVVGAHVEQPLAQTSLATLHASPSFFALMHVADSAPQIGASGLQSAPPCAGSHGPFGPTSAAHTDG